MTPAAWAMLTVTWLVIAAVTVGLYVKVLRRRHGGDADENGEP